MLKSHEKFHSVNGKRLVLVADDERINREILGNVLKDDYEVIFSVDGEDTMEKVRENTDDLSLVLLDLNMPKKSGLEVLRELKADPDTNQIPIIVITSDQKAEVDSLNMGANDFIPKPYPQTGVILARVLRTIELNEDRETISSTERDPLTGLYHREYFFHYAEQFDQHHRDMLMDAIVVDVNHFRMINERFGTAYGDEVLRRIGERVREMVRDSGGIVCRREADTFLVYCPHGKDYKAILDNASMGLTDDESANNRVRLRMGVYSNVDKSLEIERRFDRAKMAADTVRNSFTRTIGIYDSNLHEQELYSEQLIDEFDTAIREKQFKVYYQPKFDVRGEIPVLSSAEALVRWIHPQRGMISPGVFIPLFEDNGLIQTLDHYVWEETAKQIRDWKDRLNFTVPVSVNVSRIDLYDPHLIDRLLDILSQNGITPEVFLLEITESAYTRDSEQLIETVNQLRKLGFRIEMDDFGTGYSSLNMISKLPIDALKLDMQFIRNAFSEKQDTRMLEVIIDIADFLSVPVIAEGVETEEQLKALKAMGCDLVQGYYFSRPVVSTEYETFLIERKDLDILPAEKKTQKEGKEETNTFSRIRSALSSGYEHIYYVDPLTSQYVVFSSRGRYEDLQIEKSGSDFFADAQKLIDTYVVKEDAPRVALALSKNSLVMRLSEAAPYVLVYRINTEDRTEFRNLKVIRSNAMDDHHIVIGISNIDASSLEEEYAGSLRQLNYRVLSEELNSDMEQIYFVDLSDNTYVEYHLGEQQREQLAIYGSDFFEAAQSQIRTSVIHEDQYRVSTAMDKKILLDNLKEDGSFSLIYRILIDSVPTYYRLMVVLVENGQRRHIIVGLKSVEREVHNAFSEEKNSGYVTFAKMAEALASDYFCIYYVDTKDDSYLEYISDEKYHSLKIERGSEDFFNTSRRNILRTVHPEDIELFLSVFTKENVLNELKLKGFFTYTYRLMFKDGDRYVHLKVIGMADEHIVVGISDVDKQIRREQEHAKILRAANRDPLTGVKSGFAFNEDSKAIDQSIANGELDNMAVVLTNLNSLKEVNEHLGPSAGDSSIKEVCHRLCKIFDHSPVYRVGGDEFAILLKGEDYNSRMRLLEEFEAYNQSAEVKTAIGLSEYRKGEDHSILPVVERAYQQMAENKKEYRKK